MPMFFERDFDNVSVKKKKKFDDSDILEITPQVVEPETRYDPDDLEILP